jgi:hypothetical protein
MKMTTYVFMLVTLVGCGMDHDDDRDHHAHAAHELGDPVTCAGYPEPRVFLESQSWWYDDAAHTDGQSSHVHVGTCFPIYGTVSGIQSFDLVVKMHNEPVGTKITNVRFSGNVTGPNPIYLYQNNSLSLQCPSTSPTDCTHIIPITVDWSKLAVNGVTYRGTTEVRIHGQTTRPDGSRNLATNGWLLFVDNPGATLATSKAVRFPTTEGRGWYELPGKPKLGYINALLTSPVPRDPVCGVFSVRVSTKLGANEGIGTETLESSLVTIDPHLHAVPEQPGRVLFDGPGAIYRRFDIDTTQLSNGPHSLVIAARAVGGDVPAGKKLAGAQVIPFKVDNASGCAARPTIEMLWPAGVDVSGHSSFSTSAILDAFAPATGVSRVEYRMDGTSLNISDSSPSDGFDEYWNLSTVAAGTHWLTARAVLTSGAVLESPPVGFDVVK